MTPRELARLRPANTVIDGRYVQPRAELDCEVWTDTWHMLRVRIKKAERRGQIATIGEYRPVPRRPGTFSVRVRRIKHPMPRWQAWGWALTGGTFGIGGAGMVIWTFLPQILAALAIAVVTLGVFAAAAAKLRGGSIVVNQNVSIRR